LRNGLPGIAVVRAGFLSAEHGIANPCARALRPHNRRRQEQTLETALMGVVAWLAAALVFASFFMKTIVPLRTLAIAGNVAFIVYGLLGLRYGIFDKVLPILVLHIALLPLNVLRLREVTGNIKAIRTMKTLGSASDFLVPYMRPLHCPAGTVVFHQGDRANNVYLLRRGRLRLLEFDKLLPEGELFGEVAIFSEQAVRTATAVCEDDCELLSVTGEKLLELFYQDQRFAFQIARRLARYA
jgi:CRP/FNR family transcriptional regulator, cyclic AMP receptor protein